MKFTSSSKTLAVFLGLALASVSLVAQAQTPATATPPTPSAAPATAPTPATPPKAGKHKKGKPEFHGYVTAIDTAAGTITVETSKKTGKTLVITLTSTTHITRQGKKALLTDFVVGEKVGGAYVLGTDGKFNAVSLKSTPPKTKAPSTPTPPPATDASVPAAPVPAAAPTSATPTTPPVTQ